LAGQRRARQSQAETMLKTSVSSSCLSQKRLAAG
jgi:hypothetical protein